MENKRLIIEAVYQHTHGLIKSNPALIARIKNLATHPVYQHVDQYLCTGLEIDGIYLGLDFKKRHINNFLKIVTNNKIIDEISAHRADLSRVLLRVIINGNHIANLTEDVSQNKKAEIYDNGCFIGPYEDYLNRIFKNDVEKMVFMVYNKSSFTAERNGTNKPNPVEIRFPVIDLDHVCPADDIIASLFLQVESDIQTKLDLYSLEI